MEQEGQVTQPGGDQGGVSPQPAPTDSLGWRAALSDEFKEHDYVKTFTKPTDFVKAALEIKTEHESLKSKMDGALFKPGENASEDERIAFYKALGMPEKPTDYELPIMEGSERDPKMTEWAQNIFHQAGLAQDQANLISLSFDGFVRGLEEAEIEQREADKTAAEKALKQELGGEDKYNEALELVHRLWSKVSDSEFDAFINETGIGNDARLIRFVYKLALKTGEDVTLPGTPGADKVRPGILYNRSPDPPKGE